jgi:hypothetical protein
MMGGYPIYPNNVASASFYSHQPFHASGYMNSFGGSPLLPPGMHPMDMMGYGSHTINFNPRTNPVSMPTYYSDAFSSAQLPAQ